MSTSFGPSQSIGDPFIQSLVNKLNNTIFTNKTKPVINSLGDLIQKVKDAKSGYFVKRCYDFLQQITDLNTAPAYIADLSQVITSRNQELMTYNEGVSWKREMTALTKLISQFLDNYIAYGGTNNYLTVDRVKRAYISLFADVVDDADTVYLFEVLKELNNLDFDVLIYDINNASVNKNTMAQSVAPSAAVSQAPSIAISQLTTTSAAQVLSQLDISNKQDIGTNLNAYNQYVLTQLGSNGGIDYNVVQKLKDLYPFIVTDDYVRNLLNYNKIINSGLIRSNIPVDYKTLVLPVPSFQVPINQPDPLQAKSVQEKLAKGYEIVSKGKANEDLIMFKPDARSKNQFVGSYRSPKLNSSFKVTYRPESNTYVIYNRKYPTGYSKTGYGVYHYIAKLAEKKNVKPFVYMPRVVVNYQ